MGSKLREVDSVGERSSTSAANILSLQPKLFGRPRLTADSPFSSHPPQLPELPFPTRHRSTIEDYVQLSPTPKPPKDSKQRNRHTPAPNFSLPRFCPMRPRTKTRYYASALTPDDQTAMALGEQNHNLKPWKPEDLMFHEKARKDLAPRDVYIGPGKQVCIVPVIIVTDGWDRRTHDRQLAHKFRAARCGSVPSIPHEGIGPIARERAYHVAATRTASQGSYFVKGSGPVSYRPYRSMAGVRVRSPPINEVSNFRSQEGITFDSMLGSHRLGKGRTRWDGRDVNSKKAGKILGI